MNYKRLIIIPIVLLVLSLSYLFWLSSTTGLNLDIDLKGGTQIISEYPTAINEREFESILKSYDVSVRTAKGISSYTIFIEFDAEVDPNDVLNTLKENNYELKDYSVQTVGTSLGQAFFGQAMIALAFAFLFMAGAAFVIFRKPVLSLRVVFSAFSDIIGTLAVSQLLDIKLSLATFAALLLLLGYSVDDDVLLTARTIRGSGEISERIKRARKTAFTMVGTTVVALISLFIMIESIVIDQIASIMLIGLIFDLVNTWLFNAPILRWYLEKRTK